MTNCLMPECDDQSLAYEISESKCIPETRLRLEIESFCYPNANSDQGTIRAVSAAGYPSAVTTTWEHNGAELVED